MDSKLNITDVLQEALNLPYTKEGDYIEMACPQSQINLIVYPKLAEAIAEIASFRKLQPVYIMLNKLLPFSATPFHRDYLKPTRLQPEKNPTIERWHLPLVTNDFCKFQYQDALEPTTMPQGVWYGPVEYWRSHSVFNMSRNTRIHLIVDLDTQEKLGEYL